MKKWAYQKRRSLAFQASGQVMIKLRSEQFRFHGNRDKRLVRKYEGPIEVIEKVGKTSYRLQLPTRMRIYPVIHVSNLKPYHPYNKNHQHNQVTRPLVVMKDSSKKEVEEILVERTRHIGKPKHNLQEFLFKWKELPEEEISWERADDLNYTSDCRV